MPVGINELIQFVCVCARAYLQQLELLEVQKNELALDWPEQVVQLQYQL
jgi:hypothetical protein